MLDSETTLPSPNWLHLAKGHRSSRIGSDGIGSVVAWIPDRRSRIADRNAVVISLLWQLAATFFMSSCDRRHKLSQIAQRCLASYGLLRSPCSDSAPAARGIQSLCQQKLFLTATTTGRLGQARGNGGTSPKINWT